MKIAAGRHEKKRGSKRMKEFGYKSSTVWFDAAEIALVIDSLDGKPLATWLRNLAVAEALAKKGLTLQQWKRDRYSTKK